MPELPPNAVELILDLHKHDGTAAVDTLPGLWHRKLDERWEFWVNGKRETLKGGPRGDVDVAPYDCYVEFNGWPAGMFSLIDGAGTFAAGSAANYETFCKALQLACEVSV